MSRRNLYLRGSFTESNGRKVNPGNIIHNRNPKRPAQTINPNDFDKYIDILKVNNRYPIPKELTLPIYTTPYTLDEDIYLAKDSVITFNGTSPVYLNKFSISCDNNIYDISTKFKYTASAIRLSSSASVDDLTFIIISVYDNYYKIEYNVYRNDSTSPDYIIPAGCYYYNSRNSSYPSDEVPSLTFYEHEQPIIVLGLPTTVEENRTSRIVTSSLINQFDLPTTS